MRRPPSRLLPPALALLWAAPAGARAQAPDPGGGPGAALTLDAGAARVQQAGTPGLTAPSAAAGVAVARGAAAYRAAASAAAAGGRGAGRLEAVAERTLGPAGAGPVRVGAELQAARVPNTPWAVLALAGARVEVPFGAGRGRGGGAWARAQAGASRQAGGTSPGATLEAGVWRGAGPGARVVASVAGAAARVTGRGLVAAGVDAYGPGRVASGDAAFGWERAAAAGEVALAAGVRAYLPRGLRALPADNADPTAPGPALRWRAQLSAAGVAWVSRALGVTAAAGLAPNDPVRGLPAAAYLTAGVRLRARVTGRAGAERTPPDGPSLPVASAVATEAVPEIEVVPDGNPGAVAARRLRVRAPAFARRVELRGGPTAWRPVELARGEDGVWSAALALAPGPHRVQVRVDGGPWRPPGNLPAVEDELVGTAGLLVAP